MKTALFKLCTVVGLPKTLNSLRAFPCTLPPRPPVPEDKNAARLLFEKVYTSQALRLSDLIASYHPAMMDIVLQSYGYLADTHFLSFYETEIGMMLM